MNAAAAPIVVGYDGSSDSERALDWAINAAAQRSCPLRLVAVRDYESPRWLPQRAEDARHRAVQQLLTADHPGEVPVTVVEPFEEPATHGLLREASDARMMVLGARGHGVLSGLLMGSVSQHLSRHADCSVVIVREPHDSKTPGSSLASTTRPAVSEPWSSASTPRVDPEHL
ncbi:MAG: universal stress protein [Nocardioidaceae bacterium]